MTWKNDLKLGVKFLDELSACNGSSEYVGRPSFVGSVKIIKSVQLLQFSSVTRLFASVFSHPFFPNFRLPAHHILSNLLASIVIFQISAISILVTSSSHIKKMSTTFHQKSTEMTKTLTNESANDSIMTAETCFKLTSLCSCSELFQKQCNRRFSHAMKKSPQRRCRIDGRKMGKDTFAWSRRDPVDGYIQHPDAEWLMHPSFFDLDYKLCPYNGKCGHEKDCGEKRLHMAAMSYLRNKDCTSFRDLESIWGVSRSTIQRKTNEIQQNKTSDMLFLTNWWHSLKRS